MPSLLGEFSRVALELHYFLGCSPPFNQPKNKLSSILVLYQDKALLDYEPEMQSLLRTASQLRARSQIVTNFSVVKGPEGHPRRNPCLTSQTRAMSDWKSDDNEFRASLHLKFSEYMRYALIMSSAKWRSGSVQGS